MSDSEACLALHPIQTYKWHGEAAQHINNQHPPNLLLAASAERNPLPGSVTSASAGCSALLLNRTSALTSGVEPAGLPQASTACMPKAGTCCPLMSSATASCRQTRGHCQALGCHRQVPAAESQSGCPGLHGAQAAEFHGHQSTAAAAGPALLPSPQAAARNAEFSAVAAWLAPASQGWPGSSCSSCSNLCAPEVKVSHHAAACSPLLHFVSTSLQVQSERAARAHRVKELLVPTNQPGPACASFCPRSPQPPRGVQAAAAALWALLGSASVAAWLPACPVQQHAAADLRGAPCRRPGSSVPAREHTTHPWRDAACSSWPVLSTCHRPGSPMPACKQSSQCHKGTPHLLTRHRLA